MSPEQTPPRTAEPVMTTACLITNRRPADLEAYQAACRAAEGDDVIELQARAVVPEMTIWHQDRWLVVRYSQVADRSVSIDFFIPGSEETAFRLVAPTTPMYRRITARERDRNRNRAPQ